MLSQTLLLVSFIGLLLSTSVVSERRLLEDKTRDHEGQDMGSSNTQQPVEMPKNQSAMRRVCSKTHPLVGVEKDLITYFHEVSGTVKVVDDCTVVVTNFMYDGLGPAVFWYGASNKEGLEDPSAINFGMFPEGQAYNGTTLSLQLAEGSTWDMSSFLSVWCRAFAIDFGSVSLTD